MLYIYKLWRQLQLAATTQRPRVDFTSILDTVKPIVDAVAERGDEAVLEFTEKFDKVGGGERRRWWCKLDPSA